jgi:hypothetical protein
MTEYALQLDSQQDLFYVMDGLQAEMEQQLQAMGQRGRGSAGKVILTLTMAFVHLTILLNLTLNIF